MVERKEMLKYVMPDDGETVILRIIYKPKKIKCFCVYDGHGFHGEARLIDHSEDEQATRLAAVSDATMKLHAWRIERSDRRHDLWRNA